MIEVARRKAARAATNVAFQVAPIEDLPYSDGTFDLVMNTLVMHHLPAGTKRKGLAEVYRVLKPGGSFLAVDVQLPKTPVSAFIAHLFLGRHMACSDIADSLVPLREAGFSCAETGPTTNSWFAYARATKVDESRA
jgi:demethylmenaquinone methyltransferase/2-methoxy-6-polyprenyl-1,4-benzoquinol methylase/phosphoethanolamine N-methyltransferase